MKLLTRKTENSLIALILLLSIATTSILFALPIASAHTPPWTIQTNSYVAAVPSRVGLGQYSTIVVWVDYYSPSSGGVGGQHWPGFRIDITKPDGTNVTIGPFTCASAVGSDYYVYSPDQVGTYTIVFSWPGATVVEDPGLPSYNAFIGDYFAGSTSKPATLVVQEEPIEEWQEPPIPTDYWQRPINAANRNWGQLASNWLGGNWLVNNFQRWGTAPESPHVLWTQPLTPALAGGINDAQWWTIPSDVNDYESPWSAPIIMNGKIYQNAPSVADVATYGYYCRDLYTGEIIWYKNGTDNGLGAKFSVGSGYNLGQSYSRLTQGWLYHYDSVNGQGILAYLIMTDGSNWHFLDASTGNWMLTLTNVPSGTTVMDQDGNILRYSYNSKTGNLLCWNASQSIPPLEPLGSSQQQWKMRFGATIDAVNDTSWTQVGPIKMPTGMRQMVPAEAITPRSGYTLNLTVQKDLPGSLSVLQDENRVPKIIFGSYGVNTMVDAQGAGLSAFTTTDTFSAWALRIDEHVTDFSPKPEFTNTQNTNLGFGATLMWKKDFTVPVTGHNYTWNINADYDSKIFILKSKQLMQMWGYSLETGELLWGPTAAPFNDMEYWGRSSDVYYGKILSVGYGGTLYAYDAKTGELLWNYNATGVGYESPYGDNYPLSIGAVADGKVYLYSTEHSPTKPLWRGSYLRCVNVTDGTELWKLLDFNMGLSIADGLVVTGNQYDNLIYCIGKGPSATTLEAPMTAAPAGSIVVLKGMVTDQSPGAIQYAKKFGLTSGVAAVSEANQQAWMEYLYEQQTKPSNAIGVPVSIDAIDPNNNYVHIGDATTDDGGAFGYSWRTPDVPGQYKIVATFKGSASYGSSSAQTYAYVDDAAATALPYPEVVLPPTEMYVIGAAIAIIIAIAIVGALIMLMLRKRP